MATHAYDLMVLLDSNAPEDRHGQILEETRSMIESGGTLIGQHDWGNRRLAFEIDHRTDAGYTLFQFEGDPALLDRLGHALKITDGVLRHRIIGIKPGTAPPPEPRDSSRPRDDAAPEGTDRVAARAAADAPSGEDAE